MAELRYLFLQDNDLSGALPVELANLLKVIQVKLSNNTQLTGEIPFNRQNTELGALIVENTLLCAPSTLHNFWVGNIIYDGIACPSPDRGFLEDLYISLGGDNWADSTNWNDVTEELGEWEGVTTNSDGRVTGLSLPNNGLTGAIPDNLNDLLWLQTLDLSDNSLTGEFPSALAQLIGLQEVNLSNTELDGEISPVFTQASALRTLDVSGTTVCLPPDRDFQDWLDTNHITYTGDQCAPNDRTALVAFYYATDGPNWSQAVNWLSDEPLHDWSGVATNAKGRVTLLSQPAED